MTLCACENCGTLFERKTAEVNRCRKKGFSLSCSRSCGAVLRNHKHSKGNLQNLKADNRQDDFSSFRYFINKSRCTDRKQKYGEPNINVEYLKTLWETQKGICPYTGYLMELPVNTQGHSIKGKPNRASLDRIDSSKGYVQGNVEFVCLAVNYAKSHFPRSEMLRFFKPEYSVAKTV